MALVPLATVTDLTARGITAAASTSLLTAASEAVRDAAGVPISRLTSTVTVEAPGGAWLDLPGPVVSVTSVEIDGVAQTAHRVIGQSLYLGTGWQTDHCLPSVVSVTFTHGYFEVPADIVDLVCSLVGAAVAATADGYQANGGVQSRTRAFDDYRETDTYETGSAAVTGRMELPPATRRWLRERFSRGVHVTGTR